MNKLMVMTAVVAGAVSAFATTREWIGAANGAWSVPDNWDPSGAPAANDVLKFTDRGSYPSSNDLTVAVSLWFANPAGTPVRIIGDAIKLNGTSLTDGNNNNAVLSARYAKDTITIEPNVTRQGGNANIMGTASTDYPLVFNGTVSG